MQDRDLPWDRLCDNHLRIALEIQVVIYDLGAIRLAKFRMSFPCFLVTQALSSLIGAQGTCLATMGSSTAHLSKAIESPSPTSREVAY